MLKDDRHRQELIHKQYAEEASFLRDKIRSRDQMLAAQRSEHLKEVLAGKERIVKLQLQIEQKESGMNASESFEKGARKVTAEDRKAMHKMTQELLHIRTENDHLNKELSDANARIRELQQSSEEEEHNLQVRACIH